MYLVEGSLSLLESVPLKTRQVARGEMRADTHGHIDREGGSGHRDKERDKAQNTARRTLEDSLLSRTEAAIDEWKRKKSMPSSESSRLHYISPLFFSPVPDYRVARDRNPFGHFEHNLPYLMWIKRLRRQTVIMVIARRFQSPISWFRVLTVPAVDLIGAR